MVKALAADPDIRQTLLLRDPKKLTGQQPANAKVVIGNVLDKKLLESAMTGQDMVYANLTGEDLKPFSRAADAIEGSGLQYTLLRPAWLTDEDEVDYELTAKGQPFEGTVVSRRSVADLIARVIVDPALHVGESLGVNKPGSAGDKPYFM